MEHYSASVIDLTRVLFTIQNKFHYSKPSSTPFHTDDVDHYANKTLGSNNKMFILLLAKKPLNCPTLTSPP